MKSKKNKLFLSIILVIGHLVNKTEQRMITLKELRTGRPRRYKSPEEMQIRIDEYFLDNDKPTICGLTLALGFCERRALLNYEGYGKEFYDIIKRAKLIVEEYYESCLAVNSKATGAIFALKNFDWSDKQEFSLSEGFVRLNITLPALPEVQLKQIDGSLPLQGVSQPFTKQIAAKEVVKAEESGNKEDCT